MIYRLTNKLAKKIKEHPTHALDFSGNPFLDWAAEAFIAERTHYILITHSASLLSCVMHGRGITDDASFLDRANEAIGSCLRENGFEFIFESIIAPRMGEVTFSKVGNRQLTGIMVDLVKHAKLAVERYGAAPDEIGRRLNEIPQCTQKEVFPIKAFGKLQANPQN